MTVQSSVMVTASATKSPFSDPKCEVNAKMEDETLTLFSDSLEIGRSTLLHFASTLLRETWLTSKALKLILFKYLANHNQNNNNNKNKGIQHRRLSNDEHKMLLN